MSPVFSQKLKPKLVVLACSCLASLLLTEIGLRLFVPSLRSDRNTLAYRHDERLGWFPIPNSTNQFTGARSVTAVHNGEGFRGKELVKDNRPRILFLGDSFTWGYDVDEQDRFTDKLQTKHPEWDIYNLGVSGYGTDQEFLLLQQKFERYQPSVVFLTVCTDNDHEENSGNVGEGHYYKPYYEIKGDGMELKGVPVARTERAFLSEHPLLCSPYFVRLLVRAYFRATAPKKKHVVDPTAQLLLAMSAYIRARGVAFAVGVEGPHPALEQFLDQVQIPCVDLTLSPKPFRYDSHGFHWTPQGHTVVSERIEPLITRLLRDKSVAPSLSIAREQEALISFNLNFGNVLRPLWGKTNEAEEHLREAARMRKNYEQWSEAKKATPSP